MINFAGMNVDLGIWRKLTRAVLFLFAVAGILILAIWYLPLIQQNERMRQQILRLEEKKEKEKEINRQLKASVETLQSDPRAVERLARERLGYARAGETIVRFESSATNQIAAH